MYADRFVEEANKHNVQVDVSNLSIRTRKDKIEGRDICGLAYSNYNNTGNPRIIISRDCWCNYGSLTTQSDYFKEELVFHELGHAILKRSHTSEKLPDGSFKSIMHPQLGHYSRSAYKRDYYIAELFNPNEPVPAWSALPDTTWLLNDAISLNDTNWIAKDAELISVFIDSLNYKSSPCALSIKSSKNSNHKSGSWSKEIVLGTVVKKAVVHLKFEYLEKEYREGSIGVRLHFVNDKETKSFRWDPRNRSNNGFRLIEIITPEVKNFETVTVVLELDPQSEAYIVFDDIQLYYLN